MEKSKDQNGTQIIAENSDAEVIALNGAESSPSSENEKGIPDPSVSYPGPAAGSAESDKAYAPGPEIPADTGVSDKEQPVEQKARKRRPKAIAVATPEADSAVILNDSSEQPLSSEAEFNFSTMSLEDLLNVVDTAAASPTGKNIGKKIQAVKSEFSNRLRDDKAQKREEWLAKGGKEEEFVYDKESLLEEFNRAFKLFKKKRQEYVAQLNLDKEENLRIKKELLEKLKALTEESETHSSFHDFKRLQDEWRKIGHVPVAEAENIWNTYNFYVDRFYEQQSVYSELKELDRKRNLEAKEELVGKIEALAGVENINEALHTLHQLQEEWRHIGPVPRENLEPVIQRYKAAIIALYDRREKHSEELQARREQNYEAKLALLAKIEEIAAFESQRWQDWVNKNQELGQWLENWRSVGPVPAVKGQELKDRLVAAVKQFNKRKNEFFHHRKKEQYENQKQKLKLIEQVEQLVKSENPASHRKEVIRLQDDWKKTGPINPRLSDKLWKRFRAGCDAFFGAIHQKEGESAIEQQENLEKKKALLVKIEDLLKQDSLEGVEETIRHLQEEWNAIGFVPYKEKDQLRKEFFDGLKKLLEKSGKSDHASGLGFRLVVQRWASEPGSARKLDQERMKMVREIKRLESEVATLENNMQFFRNSEKAGELRASFEHKVRHFHEKIAELQDKVNIIRSAENTRG